MLRPRSGGICESGLNRKDSGPRGRTIPPLAGIRHISQEIPVLDGSSDEHSPPYDELREENAHLRGASSSSKARPPSWGVDRPQLRQLLEAAVVRPAERAPATAQGRRERRAAKRKPGKQPGTEANTCP